MGERFGEYPGPVNRRYAARRASGTPVSWFLAAHVVLAMILQSWPMAGTAHSALTIFVAVWAVLRWSDFDIARVAAYAAGCDVLWRMTGATTPWESGKYIVVFLCLAALLRMGRRAKWSFLPLAYFLLLLPSIVVLVQNHKGDWTELRGMLSFNLSGPLSLFASVWFMSQLRLNRRNTRHLMLALLAPLLTIAVITLIKTYTATDLAFTDESNFVTSGGFGPNQVSAVLGLGALLSLFLALDPELGNTRRWIAFGSTLMFSVQSAMTFSRGGLYAFLAAFFCSAFVLLRERSSSKWVVRFVGVAALLTIAVIIPRLESFTQGALAARFQDTNTGRRSAIILEDLRIWGEHPLLGVGPGAARFERKSESRVAHTEYTRLLSEHGIPGVLAMIVLGILFLQELSKRQPRAERGLRLAFLVWGLVSMTHVGMRIAAIGLVFGWGCSRKLLAREGRKASPFQAAGNGEAFERVRVTRIDEQLLRTI